ncbi:MAG: hypothetical protein WC354_06435, partial [Candidatus Omnitrophota bacterium]
MLKNKRGIPVILFLSALIFPASGIAAGQEDFVYNPAGKRDPFIQLVTPDGRFQKLEADEARGTDSHLKLEGIMYDPEGVSFAIVNGLVVKELDEVDGSRVVSIGERSVTF